MMKAPQKTVGNLIERQTVSFISSVDENGFPYTKAMLLLVNWMIKVLRKKFGKMILENTGGWDGGE
jgi:hypothetical protein